MLILDIVMRYLHIVSAILAVGGLSFVAACLTPAMRVLDDGFRAQVAQVVMGRFVKIVWLAIAGLIVSGVYNWIMLAGTYKDLGPKGNALIGTKVLLAVILFGIIAAEATGWIKPKKPKGLMILKLHLAAIVILLGSILRALRLDLLVT
jgi:uncharacterized membrane protein